MPDDDKFNPIKEAFNSIAFFIKPPIAISLNLTGFFTGNYWIGVLPLKRFRIAFACMLNPLKLQFLLEIVVFNQIDNENHRRSYFEIILLSLQ
ncbi:hypothetical protein QD47_25595 [Paenibacillus terrae]|uniref:Uncharacterized protein n=1 Tax=Paenibacillus terrae TaxID=159743 RepID=A0A0D7WUQ1_9BACL|nr:hypothetical protein QD47_25595 [Paenibacillus terrae]